MTLSQIAKKIEEVIKDELDYALDDSLMIPVQKFEASLEDTGKVLAKLRAEGRIRSFMTIQQEGWDTTHWHIRVDEEDFVQGVPARLIQFDAKTGTLQCGERKTKIRPSTNTSHVCRTVFSRPLGEIVQESDILDSIRESKRDNNRLVYDAVNAINKTAKYNLGIQKLLTWERNHVRVNV